MFQSEVIKMATTLSVRIVNKNDKHVILPWVFIDIFEEQTMKELFQNLKNGYFPHVKLSKSE